VDGASVVCEGGEGVFYACTLNSSALEFQTCSRYAVKVDKE
jgi:hypothetical protein